MNGVLKAARDRLLAAPDSVCLERAELVTEAYRAHEGEPVALLRARAFAHVLEIMILDVNTNPIYAGTAKLVKHPGLSGQSARNEQLTNVISRTTASERRRLCAILLSSSVSCSCAR